MLKTTDIGFLTTGTPRNKSMWKILSKNLLENIGEKVYTTRERVCFLSPGKWNHFEISFQSSLALSIQNRSIPISLSDRRSINGTSTTLKQGGLVVKHDFKCCPCTLKGNERKLTVSLRQSNSGQICRNPNSVGALLFL